MLEGPLKDPMGLGWPQVLRSWTKACFPSDGPHENSLRTDHSTFMRSIAQFMLVRSVWGFKLRDGEMNAARHAGNSGKSQSDDGCRIVRNSGGLAGVSEVAGLKGYLTADLSPGFGYTGIVVAMLAGLSPPVL